MSSLYAHPAQTRAHLIETAQEFGYGKNDASDTGFMGAMSPPTTHNRASSISAQARKAKHGSSSRPRTARNNSASAITPPAPGQNEVRPPTSSKHQHSHDVPSSTASSSTAAATETNGHAGHDHAGHNHANGEAHNHAHAKSGGKLAKDAAHAEEGHGHDHSHGSGGHSHGGHSHGSMNMRGVFLHVLGDA